MWMLLTLAAAAQDPESSDEPSQDTPPAKEDDDEADEIIVVTAGRGEQKISETVVVTEVVTSEDIEEVGAIDAAEALQMAPGVQITQSFRGSGVSLQGLDSKYVLILVNGQRVTGRSDGVFDLSRIPAERIERIEVVKGSASALYGSEAIAGVINIILKEPTEKLSADLGARYGSLHSVNASAGLGTKQDSWSAGADGGFRRNDAIDRDPSDLQTDGNARQEYTVGGHASVKPSVNLTLDSAADYSYRDLTGIDVGAGDKVVDRRNLIEDASVHLSADLLAGENTRLTSRAVGSIVRDQYLQDQRNSTVEDKYEEQQDRLVQAEVQATHFFASGHTLTGVVEGTTEFMSTPRLVDGEGQRMRGAVAAMDEWRLKGPEIVISPSARFDYDTIFGGAPSPRLALRYDPTQTLALRLAGGQSWTAPSFDELYLFFENPSVGYQVEGNPDLMPETANKLDASVEYSPVDPVTVRIDGFWTHVDDAIEIDYLEGEQPQRYVYVNISEKLARGGEATLTLRPTDWLSASGGYLYTDVQYLSGEPLIGSGSHRASWNLTGDFAGPDLALNWSGEWVGPRYFWDDIAGCDVSLDDGWAPAYTHMRARAEKRILQGRVKLYAGVNNLLDAGDACYAHLDPRFFYGGASAHLARK